MTNWNNNEEALKLIPLPANTRTYNVIPHNVFIEELQEQLDKKNLQIINKRYLTNKNGLILTGEYGLNSEEDNEVSMSLGFHNSYNKMMRAGLYAGMMVLVCKNGAYRMENGETYNKKHCTGSLDELRNHMKITIEKLPEAFDLLIQEKEAMKQIELNKQTIAQMIGDMYLNEDLITDTQLSIINREMHFSQNFKDNSAWSMYNWITEALKNSNPKDYMRSHLKVHTYVSNKLQLTDKRKNLYGVLEVTDLPFVETVHQIDLEESIAEIKAEQKQIDKLDIIDHKVIPEAIPVDNEKPTTRNSWTRPHPIEEEEEVMEDPNIDNNVDEFDTFLN